MGGKEVTSVGAAGGLLGGIRLVLVSCHSWLPALPSSSLSAIMFVQA